MSQRTLGQRMFMLIAGMVILANICAGSIFELQHFRYDGSTVKEELKSGFHNDLVFSNDEILTDIEENEVEVEEEKKKGADPFHSAASYVSSGASLFNWSSAKAWIDTFSGNCQNLSLFILFENFRL